MQLKERIAANGWQAPSGYLWKYSILRITRDAMHARVAPRFFKAQRALAVPCATKQAMRLTAVPSPTISSRRIRQESRSSCLRLKIVSELFALESCACRRDASAMLASTSSRVRTLFSAIGRRWTHGVPWTWPPAHSVHVQHQHLRVSRRPPRRFPAGRLAVARYDHTPAPSSPVTYSSPPRRFVAQDKTLFSVFSRFVCHLHEVLCIFIHGSLI